MDPGGASGDEAGVGEQHEEASWRQTEEAAKAAAAVRDEVERARLNRQLDDALSCLSTLAPTTTFGPEAWHWIEMVVRSMWSRDDARDHLAREADIRRRTGRRALPFDSQAGVYAVLDKWLEEQGMSFSAVEVTFHDGSEPHPQAVTSAMKGAPGTVTLTAYQREMVSVLRLMYTDVASDAPDHRLAEQVWRDGERVFGAPWTALYMEQQQAEVRLREPEGRIISWSLFHDKSNKFGRDFYPVFAVCNHLSLEEKRKPANWVLVAIWPILHFEESPPIGETQRRRQRAHYLQAVLDALLLQPALATAMKDGMHIAYPPGSTGPAHKVWPRLQTSILDHPEKCADAKCKSNRCGHPVNPHTNPRVHSFLHPCQVRTLQSQGGGALKVRGRGPASHDGKSPTTELWRGATFAA